MATATIENNSPQSKMQSDQYWEAGRLVAHTVGSEAGLMRLDIDLPGLSSIEDAMEQVKLVIPGETSPLTPTDATGGNGRFILSFFSSDIANAGHLPADAAVTWEMQGQGERTQHVNIESAEQVLQSDGEEAVNIPGGDPSVVYPRTVILMVLLAVGVLIVAAMLNLS